MTWPHFRVLMWKNALVKMRQPTATACEAGLPLSFVLLMMALYYAFSWQTFDTQAFTNPWGVPGLVAGVAQDVERAVPFSVLPLRLRLVNAVIAVAPRRGEAGGARAAAEAFVRDMTQRYPPLNGSQVPGAPASLSDVFIPGFGDVVRLFDSEADVEAYVRDDAYALDARARVWAAIVFNAGPPAWDYTIRLNFTETPTTNQPPTNNLQRGVVRAHAQRYAMSTPTTTVANPFSRAGSTVISQKMPGFMTLQLMVDRWIINRTAAASEVMDANEAVATFAYMLGFAQPNFPSNIFASNSFLSELQTLNRTNATRALQIMSSIVSFMAPERYLPQQVDFVPFPIFTYQTNGFYQVAQQMFAFFFVFCFLFPVSRLIRGLVNEKETKIREGMRMMGLSDSALFGSWLATYAILYLVIAAIIAIITRPNLFRASNGGLVFLVFFLFGLSSVTYCYLVSVFFSRAKTASTLGVVLFLASFFPWFAVNPPDFSYASKTASSLLSTTAFGLALDVLATYEDEGQGVTLATLNVLVRNYTMATALGMMMLDFVLYGVLAWYIDGVLPAKWREFGVPRPWNFPFTIAYWREVFNLPPAAPTTDRERLVHTPSTAAARCPPWCGRRSAAAEAERKHNGKTDPSFIEEVDAVWKAKERDNRCVMIRKLRKEFDTPDGIKVAVDDVDMTMYEGQIFVLLGHNGAGKSTTINMLTGMLEPTGGTLHALGRDLSRELTAVRRDLGVCPQHDVLWPELTVKEHLQLYARIKGIPVERTDAEINNIIRDVGLTEKVNYFSSQLSGGQKRKLSVAIALIGGSKLVFLDEPTSGMDPYSRRSTWQVLENARSDRIIILTTHFMDEADILGDRICIMANGVVKCCGSSMFLKRRYGVGYLLSIVKGPRCEVSEVLDLCRRYVPEVAISTNVGAELVLRLPLGASATFPAMFAEMDAQAPRLGLVTYGIGITTMEEVFLKVAHGEQPDTAVAPGPALQNGSTPSSPSKHAAPLTLEDVSADPKVNEALEGGSVQALGTRTSSTAVHHSHVHVATSGAPTTSALSSKPTEPAQQVSQKRAGGLAAVRAAARSTRNDMAMHLTHFRALFLKRAHTSRRDFKAVCYQLLIPAIIVLGGLGLLKATAITGFPAYQFSTAQLNANLRVDANRPQHPNRVPFLTFKSTQGPFDSPSLSSLLTGFPQANASTQDPAMQLSLSRVLALPDPYSVVRSSSAPARDIQRLSSFLLQDKPTYAGSKYGAYIVTRDGTLFPSQDAVASPTSTNVVTYTVLHNTTALHAAPLFMNLMNSRLATLFNGDTITTRTHALPFTKRQATVFAAIFSFVSATIIIMAFAFIPASYAIYIVKEREVSAKHQQLISGVSIPAYWLSTFVWDYASFMIPAFLTVIICKGYDIAEFISPERDRISAFIVLFLLYGMSAASFTYCLTYLFKSHSSAQNVVLFINVFCMILMIASLIMSQVESTCRADIVLRHFYRLLPGFGLGNGLIQLSFLDLLPVIDAQCDRLTGVATSSGPIAPYNAFDLRAAGTNMIYMGVESVLYFVLTLGIDMALSHPRFRLWFSRDPVIQDAPADDDEDVVAEQQRVAGELQEATREGSDPLAAFQDVILLNNVRKVYQTGKVAVRGLSFGIPVGQVFGFLGINGAGKTTTLQILSGDVLPSSGSARLAGFDIISQQPQVRRLLGYCPQHEALLELLTAREHLELYARIKGVPEGELKRVVDAKLREMDLIPFANKKAGTLSGGNKRKLSVAIALIGNPPLVFLDEPSTGMDPVARRFMWDVITRVATQDQLCSIILTTHSMEECEALCQRVGIMVGGRMRCLGSIQHLKNRFGRGFMTEIKLDEPPRDRIDALVASMRSALKVGPDVGFLSRGQVRVVAEALGNLPREAQICDSGSGWAIAAAFAHSDVPSPTLPSSDPSRSIPLVDFAAWWAGEDMARNVAAYVTAEAFPGGELLERHGTQLRFKLPPQQEPLGVLFSKLEFVRSSLGIKSYSLGQTSLEQIFVYFAGCVRGPKQAISKQV